MPKSQTHRRSNTRNRLSRNQLSMSPPRINFLTPHERRMSRQRKELPTRRLKKRTFPSLLQNPDDILKYNENFNTIKKFIIEIMTYSFPHKLHKIPKILEKIKELFPLDKLSYINRGSYGMVFSYLDKVLKISIFEEKEFNIHKSLEYTSIVPKIFQHHIIENISILVMEKVNGFLKDYLSIKRTPDEIHQIVISVEHIIDILCQNNVLHGDFHVGNFAMTEFINEDKEIYVLPIVIDFGLSEKTKCVPSFEIIQLLRTLSPDFINNIDRENTEMLKNQLIILYHKYTGAYLLNDWKFFDMLFERMLFYRRFANFSELINKKVKE